ncbi:MAG: hypothetical protein ACKO38_07330, partial [Planctomycetota bacterium]
MNAKREAWIAGLLAVLAGFAAIAAWMGETRRSDREPRAFPGGDAAWIASSGERSEESVGGNDDVPATGRAPGTLAAIDPADPAFAAGRVAPASHLTTATLLAAAATGQNPTMITINDGFQTVTVLPGQKVNFRCFGESKIAIIFQPPINDKNWSVREDGGDLSEVRADTSYVKKSNYTFELKGIASPLEVQFIEPVAVNPFQLSIDAVYRGPFSASPATQSSDSSRINLFLDSPYIRIEGRGLDDSAQIELCIREKLDGGQLKAAQKINNFDVRRNGNQRGSFSIVARIDRAPENFNLYLRQVTKEGHSVEAPIYLKKTKLATINDRPTVDAKIAGTQFSKGDVVINLTSKTTSTDDLHATAQLEEARGDVLAS